MATALTFFTTQRVNDNTRPAYFNAVKGLKPSSYLQHESLARKHSIA